MLTMRPECQICLTPLPADRDGALICSFECTFCQTCNEARLNYVCPNCGGDLKPRPLRTGQALVNHPPERA